MKIKNTHLLTVLVFTTFYSKAQKEAWDVTDKGCQVLTWKKSVPKWSGDCKEGYADGFGKLKYGDYTAFEFEGTMLKGKKEGAGNLKVADINANFLYEGGFKNNMFFGHGALSSKDIVPNDGLILGTLSGKGKYIGNFSNNQFEGIGSLYDKINELKLTGFWINGRYTGISFWRKEDFSSGKIYDSYQKTTVKQLQNIKGQYISIDTIITRNTDRFYNYFNNLHLDFSEDSKLLYSNAYGKTIIFDCENNVLIKTDIFSLEEKYSTDYKIDLAKNRAFNSVFYFNPESRDYCFNNNSNIYVEKFTHLELRGFNNSKSIMVGGVRIYDYKTDDLIGEYYLNSDPKEFKKESSNPSSLNYLAGMADSPNSDAFYENLGGLIRASITDGMNSKPNLGLVHAVAVNPQYNYIVSSHIYLKDIHLWATNKDDKTKINNSAPALLLKGHTWTPSHFLFDRTGRYLVSVEDGDGAVGSADRQVISILWDMTNKKQIRIYKDYFAESISKDGRFLILSKKYIVGKILASQKPEFIVVDISSGEIKYEYKGELLQNMATGIVITAYFSPDQRKIGIACLYTPNANKVGLKSNFYCSYAIIYPDYDFTPKVSESAKINSLQSIIPFPINKNALSSLLPFTEVLTQNLKSQPKSEPKSEFETPDEFSKRSEKEYQGTKAILQKYWEKAAGFYVETIANKEIFTCKPSSLVKYDAIGTEYTISISGYEAKIKIPAQEAKAMKEKGIAGCTITGEKIALEQTGLYSYKNLVLKNSDTGKNYSGSFITSFSHFISN